LDIDDIYWHALHNHEDDGDGLNLLDPAMLAEMDGLVDKKMEQRMAYLEECTSASPMSRPNKHRILLSDPPEPVPTSSCRNHEDSEDQMHVPC
jgi:hypothetical protein